MTHRVALRARAAIHALGCEGGEGIGSDACTFLEAQLLQIPAAQARAAKLPGILEARSWQHTRFYLWSKAYLSNIVKIIGF